MMESDNEEKGHTCIHQHEKGFYAHLNHVVPYCILIE